MSRRISPNKDVCAEGVVMARLGFEHVGPTGTGHLLFRHAEYGEIVMAGTPRDWNWRRSHRTLVARAMGLSRFQLERVINGQPSAARQVKRSRKPPRRRRETPRALRHLTPVEPDPAPAAAEPAPVKPAPVWEPSDPICGARREAWRSKADELARLNAQERLNPRRAAA